MHSTSIHPDPSPKIIAIAGPAGSGKDTAANFINRQNNLYCKYRFADPIKRTIKTLFDFTEEQIEDRHLKEQIDLRWGFSPREAMQRFGTEFGRDLKDDIWLKFAERALHKNGNLVIGDCRFENEAEWVRNNGGQIIQIYPSPSASIASVPFHRSEGGIVRHEDTIYIMNDLVNLDLFEDTLAYHLRKLAVI